MRSKNIKNFFIGLIILILLYWIPFLLVLLGTRSYIFSSIDSLPQADAVIVFGAIVENEEITPLHQERLEAARMIYLEEKIDSIVVSNSPHAVRVMADYLIGQGLSSGVIEIDESGEKTPDTCRFEKGQYSDERELIFVSQGFHLPRLLYQCKKLGIEGIGFRAESIDLIDRSKYSFFTKLSVRSKRYMREAGLTWLAFLGIYQ